VTICLQTLDQETVLIRDLEKDMADVVGKRKKDDTINKQVAATEIISGQQEHTISADEHILLH
jgi:hypothetical protein